ncbi:MAG: 4Fe-4S ferredoxin [Fibrobacteria bacterium]|nr:4Fe-4S ferredoxin [Fibrobacteria bacterium]
MSDERQTMQVDIVCVGFGPSTAGFLHTLNKSINDENGMPVLQSQAVPGMPLQVMCYERADDISFGVSGIVTEAKAIKESLSAEELSQIPMATSVKNEEIFYLLDSTGASRRSGAVKFTDKLLNMMAKDGAYRLPVIPGFLNKHNGMIFSMGQFMQWVGAQIMGAGLIQVWPAMPVDSALIENQSVKGVRLADQGVDKNGKPDAGYMPGMDVQAALTVVGDGPVGPVGQQLNRHFGMPEGNHLRDWAVGMKAVVELPENSALKEGTVIHTLGFPEPEIFGFMYGLPDNKASLGIFVPSWFENPARNVYRYFQHWMQHPKMQVYLKDATLTSWGAKSLQEDGLRGEPLLVGDGFARIGEGSGCTNILSNSGVDEAWKSGVLLAEGVISLLKNNEPFTKENLERAYVGPRRKSWIHTDNIKAKGARDGFQSGFVKGMIGMGTAGISGGKFKYNETVKRPHEGVNSYEEYFKGIITPSDLESIKKEAFSKGTNLYDAIMDKAGWPKIQHDNKLFVSHQDALLLGGKVQANAGYADHVVFTDEAICKACGEKRCVDMCSGQAIIPGENGVPEFDREKCVHCGACLWNCTRANKENPEESNIQFKAGSGGLHSAEN